MAFHAAKYSKLCQALNEDDADHRAWSDNKPFGLPYMCTCRRLVKLSVLLWHDNSGLVLYINDSAETTGVEMSDSLVDHQRIVDHQSRHPVIMPSSGEVNGRIITPAAFASTQECRTKMHNE